MLTNTHLIFTHTCVHTHICILVHLEVSMKHLPPAKTSSDAGAQNTDMISCVPELSFRGLKCHWVAEF
jgi:hypothetical protein